MQKFPLHAASLALAGLTLLPGCASIVGSDEAAIAISSTPANAQILVIDEGGRTVYRGRTPKEVTLAKSSGHYWGGKQYTVAVSKRGYTTQRIAVDTRPNALYLGGNLLSANLVGWFLVDPLNGGMYEFNRDHIAVELAPLPGPEAAAARAAEAELAKDTADVVPPAEAASTAAATAPDAATATLPPIVVEAAPPAGDAVAATAAPASTEPSAPLFVPAQPPEGGQWKTVDTPREAPAPPPAAAPAPAKPYLPPPPPLPVWPSSALPAAASFA